MKDNTITVPSYLQINTSSFYCSSSGGIDGYSMPGYLWLIKGNNTPLKTGLRHLQSLLNTGISTIYLTLFCHRVVLYSYMLTIHYYCIKISSGVLNSASRIQLQNSANPCFTNDHLYVLRYSYCWEVWGSKEVVRLLVLVHTALWPFLSSPTSYKLCMHSYKPQPHNKIDTGHTSNPTAVQKNPFRSITCKYIPNTIIVVNW